MKARTLVAVLCLGLVLGFGAEAVAQKAKGAAKGPDGKVIAAQLVKQVANVKEGEIVYIEGDVRDIDLLEDLTIEVQKRGAHALLLLGREKFDRRWFDEVPEKYDAKRPTLAMKLWQLPSVQFIVWGSEFPGQLKHVPSSRMAAHSKAWEPFDQLVLKRNVRRVFLGNGLYPTAAMAKRFGMTKDQLAKVYWDGLGVDQAKLQAAAEAVRAVLARGKEVHLTNPNGTDLRFRIQNRPVLTSDGVISDAKAKKGGAAAWVYLPAGEVYTTSVPGTAEGKVVVDRSPFADGEILGLTVTFKAGKVTTMTAKPSKEFDRLKALYAAAGPRKDEFGAIDIGVNPNVKIPKGSKLLTWVAEGMVTTGIGGNLDLGGDNSVAFGSYWHLPGSTLLVDGKPLVEKGVLKVPGLTTASR